jgi:Na+/H+ antiporter NhaC
MPLRLKNKKIKGGKTMIRVNKTIFLVLVLLFSVVWLWAGSESEAKGIHAATLKGDLVKVKAFLKQDASWY